MDAVIAGIVIVVVTGVLVSLVRRGASKPRPPRRHLDQMDPVDLDIAEGSLHRTLADIIGSDPTDGDFGH